MKNQFPKIITIGAATIDAFVYPKGFREMRSKKFSTGVGECFSLGTKIDIDQFVLSTGGGATNAAATFANLGYRPACLSAVGDDLFGSAIRQDFKKRNISTTLLVELKKYRTAFSTILVMGSGERTVLVHRGASEKLSSKNVPWNRVRGDWIYMTSLGGNMSLLRAIVAHAKKRKINIFWNPGAKNIKHGIKKLKASLREIDILDVNREEAAELTGVKMKDTRGILAQMHKLVPGVILTDGSKGAYWSDGEQTLFAKPTGAKAVNRTGAGDAFGSGFMSSFVRHEDPVRALQLGTLNAEGVIQIIGTKAGLLEKWPGTRQYSKVKVTKK